MRAALLAVLVSCGAAKTPMRLLAQAQTTGLVVHRLGVLVLQRRRIGGAVLREG